MKKIAKEVSSEAVSEVMQENQARAVVYNFLSSLFAKELNKDLVSQLTSTQGLRFLNSLALEKKLAPSINIISTQLTKLNSKQSLLELAADFCGLFLVDGRTSVSPYAGQYLSSKLNKVCSDELTSKKKQHKAQLFGDYHG
jgi:TorA-specific chaperone